MKTLIGALTLTFVLGSFASDNMITRNLNTTTKLFASEAQALQAGLVVEEKIAKGKFKSPYANGSCEWARDAKYSKDSIEVKKLYVNGEAKFQAQVNYTMTCEEEYQM